MYSQPDRHCEKPFFSGSILGSLVNLFPQCQIVVCSAMQIGVEWNASDAMKHYIGNLFGTSVIPKVGDRALHAHQKVSKVHNRPACLLRHTRQYVNNDFRSQSQHRVNNPGTCRALATSRDALFDAYLSHLPSQNSGSCTRSGRASLQHHFRLPPARQQYSRNALGL